MNREQIRDMIVGHIGPAVGHADANRVADVLLAAHQADLAAAWALGHVAGRNYQGDGWNSDAHDPERDNPYATNLEGTQA